MALTVALFALSLAGVVAGSVYLSRWLGDIRTLFRIPEQFMGFLTALGADSPEITSAIVAMLAGDRDTGVGVVFGSNLFNLAFLLGLSAIFAGGISVRRNAAILDGIVGTTVTALGVALALGLIPSAIALCAILAVMGPYVTLLALRRPAIEHAPVPRVVREFMASAASDKRQKDADPADDDSARSTPKRAWAVVKVFGALAVIVAASAALVHSTTNLTSGWLPKSLLGSLVLASLTGIPNFYTAVRLGMKHRGSAVVTETMNSNSINVLVGLAVPSIVFGATTAHTTPAVLEALWLFAMTAGAAVLMAVSRGLKREHGMTVLAAYAAFVALRIYLA